MELDGTFNCFALMDAASRFILAAEMVPGSEPESTQMHARRLFKTAWAHHQQLRTMLFVPEGQFKEILSVEAKRQGISVVTFPESQLLVFIGAAQKNFAEQVR